MSEAIQNIRVRPLGRGTFVGGFFATLAVHAALGGLVWYGNVKDPPREEKPREILLTEMVKLGKPREKFWLPRIVQPPPPKIVEPTIKVAEDPNAAPAVKEKEKEKPEKPEISKSVQDVLNRRRALLQNAIEEPDEGLATGSARGTANTATAGDPYATEIRDLIQSNWNVPTGLSIGDAVNLEAEIRIKLAEDGTMLEPKVTRSSGNPLYDASCIQAIVNTRRVPPPPPDKRALYRRGIIFPFDGKSLAR